MNKHYVCAECGGESLEPRNCETDSCSLKGKPLSECDCGDGFHGKVRANQTI